MEGRREGKERGREGSEGVPGPTRLRPLACEFHCWAKHVCICERFFRYFKFQSFWFSQTQPTTLFIIVNLCSILFASVLHSSSSAFLHLDGIGDGDAHRSCSARRLIPDVLLMHGMGVPCVLAHGSPQHGARGRAGFAAHRGAGFAAHHGAGFAGHCGADYAGHCGGRGRQPATSAFEATDRAFPGPAPASPCLRDLQGQGRAWLARVWALEAERQCSHIDGLPNMWRRCGDHGHVECGRWLRAWAQQLSGDRAQHVHRAAPRLQNRRLLVTLRAPRPPGLDP